jgi:hypothetical protein
LLLLLMLLLLMLLLMMLLPFLAVWPPAAADLSVGQFHTGGRPNWMKMGSKHRARYLKNI